ncbi:hypothetical protein HZA33_00275 [Candidatus Pacearchaeota archaeon]|nr:hypothetical protein [Candidatus Pacearchaeota archaeon]
MKKAISTLVATVLLILIVIALIAIIWGAVLPMITRSTEIGQACSDARISINTISGYSCYSENAKTTMVMIDRASEKELAGLQISLREGGKRTAYIIRKDSSLVFLVEFEEGSGNIIREYISDAQYPVSPATPAVWSIGRLGNSLVFDGTTFVSAQLDSSKEITIETWVKPE